MPKAFENCVKRGGKVRTKEAGEGKFMRICVLDGKSYAGEVMKKKVEKKPDKPVENQEKIEILEELQDQHIWIQESQSFSINEKKEDGTLSVSVDVVEAGLSSNGRHYFKKELESQKLKGLKVFMDHNYDARNSVGKIEESAMVNSRRLGAKLWVKNSSMHPDIVEMLEDGRVDAVSIGGSGDIKRVKKGDKVIDEVHNLQIKELSFVGIGGVSSAKVKTIGG